MYLHTNTCAVPAQAAYNKLYTHIMLAQSCKHYSQTRQSEIVNVCTHMEIGRRLCGVCRDDCRKRIVYGVRAFFCFSFPYSPSHLMRCNHNSSRTHRFVRTFHCRMCTYFIHVYVFVSASYRNVYVFVASYVLLIGFLSVYDFLSALSDFLIVYEIRPQILLFVLFWVSSVVYLRAVVCESECMVHVTGICTIA